MIKAYTWKPSPRSALFALVIVAFFALAGCEEWADKSRYNAPDDHTVSKKKAKHLPGLNDPGINCTQCHGLDLTGGSTGVSCFECHGKKWTGTDAAGAEHTILKGDALHRVGLENPQNNCASCHGSDLRGGGVGVSCYQCHGELWAGGASFSSTHTVNRGGTLHKPGLTDPQNNCVSCHGSDLRGGSVGVSCYKCHGELWAGGGAFSSTHTINKDDALHRPGLKEPAANCASCHGSDLRGGSVGVSCFKCHGNKWSDEDDDDDDDD